MRIRFPRPLLLPGLAIFLAALTAVVPAPPARAEEEPTSVIAAWSITADFTAGAPNVVVTEYTVEVYASGPPAVAEWTSVDITGDCAAMGTGTISYQNGYAIFDGASYLRCTLPPLQINTLDCQAESAGYFYFGADVKLKPTSQINPLLTASNGSFALSLPSDGIQARTRVRLPSYGYQSSLWPRDANGNEVLMGQGGEIMVQVANTPDLDLLTFLTPAWQPFFANLNPSRVGHWANWTSGTRTWSTNAASLPFVTPPPFVDIGHNNGTFFNGQIAVVEGDPPGCTAE